MSLSIPLTQTISPHSSAPVSRSTSTTNLIPLMDAKIGSAASVPAATRTGPPLANSWRTAESHERAGSLQQRNVERVTAGSSSSSEPNTLADNIGEKQGAEKDVKQEKEEEEDESSPIPVRSVWPPWKRRDGWSGWMSDTVTADALVLSLILQAFSTGILDATTYLDFNTFASNQTGNTILLTVAVVRVSGRQLLLTGISLGSFLGAAFVFAQIGHFCGVRRRIWLLTNVWFQLFCLMLAAIFLSPHGPALTRLNQKHDWAIISLFAIMSGAQVAAARQASIQEIPTAPMTSSYVDLVGDKYIFAGFGNEKGRARNRRLAYIMAMIVGSFIGGIMHKYAGSWVVVVVAMSFKLAVIVLISIAPADPPKKKKSKQEAAEEGKNKESERIARSN
ncbi:hypothetical protein I317_00877 [Kwoniella heveanensis CBS 569]|nr:hypothetical protein I317_00877 [Kwoniella heveanensis CBS 569]